MRDKRTLPEKDRLQAAKFVASDAPSGAALWRSGDAADCKSVYAGSIPAGASSFPFPAHLPKSAALPPRGRDLSNPMISQR